MSTTPACHGFQQAWPWVTRDRSGQSISSAKHLMSVNNDSPDRSAPELAAH
jgi:hypothetical protein